MKSRIRFTSRNVSFLDHEALLPMNQNQLLIMLSITLGFTEEKGFACVLLGLGLLLLVPCGLVHVVQVEEAGQT